MAINVSVISVIVSSLWTFPCRCCPAQGVLVGFSLQTASIAHRFCDQVFPGCSM